MYIQTTKNSKGQCYYHLVESYREKGKSKKRMLMSLGKAGEGGEDKINSLAQAVSRHRELLTVSQLAKELYIEETFILGPLLILQKLFDQLEPLISFFRKWEDPKMPLPGIWKQCNKNQYLKKSLKQVAL